MMRLTSIALLLFAGAAVAGKEKTSILQHQGAATYRAVCPSAGAPGQSIRDFSGLFLGNPYVANRLIGSSDTQEQLVVDFGGLDCFTYLDYVESLRRATSVHHFIENLMHTRYVNVSQLPDQKALLLRLGAWRQQGERRDPSGGAAVTTAKLLNQKADGGHYIPGLG